jgi:hypothetical protein
MKNEPMLLDDGTYYFQINEKKEAAFRKSYRALHQPGIPCESDGFYKHAKTGLKKVRNPNIGRFANLERDKVRYGWLDNENSIWVPSGPSRHGALASWHVENVDGTRRLVFSSKKRRQWTGAQQCAIECEKVVMRCFNDEEAFFEWVKRISCIEHIEGSEDKLRFVFATYDLDEQHVSDLYALFRRYKIEMNLLKDFLKHADNRKLVRLL